MTIVKTTMICTGIRQYTYIKLRECLGRITLFLTQKYKQVSILHFSEIWGKKCYKKIFIGQIKTEITLLNLIRAWKSRGFSKNRIFRMGESIKKIYWKSNFDRGWEHTHTLYLFIHSFFVRDGTASEIFSQRSFVFPSYVFKACSNN